MTDAVDQEIEAIRAVLGALTPLSEAARLSVLEYVAKRLDLTSVLPEVDEGASDSKASTPAPEVLGQEPAHIKTLKEQKKPRSANEMAAIVAYYLANVAPSANRKTVIRQKDVETYFKIAGFPLPQQVRNTLPNAKAAGYFDLAGEGGYKLNAVGHNLVAHAMPRGAGRATTSGRRPKKRPKAPTRKSRARKR